MTRIAATLALLALAAPLPAAAHEPGTPTGTGYVATVAAIRPNVVGLSARGVYGDQILVSNLTRSAVVILDRKGGPWIRIPRGSSRAWHDVRVVEKGPPPAAAPGTSETAPRFVRYWSIPARAGTRRFAIQGFIGWVPPRQSRDDGTSAVLLAGGALLLVALSAVAAYLLGRGRS